MAEKKKSSRQIFLDGDVDGIPIDEEELEKWCKRCPVDTEIDLTQKLGLTDNLYILMGLDLRWLKRFNPKNHVIF